MKSRMLILALMCAALVVFPKLSIPAERATEEDAVRMVETAGKMIEEMAMPPLRKSAIHRADVFDCERNLTYLCTAMMLYCLHTSETECGRRLFSRHPEDYGNEPVSVTVSI